MSIKPLNERLDELDSAEKDVAELPMKISATEDSFPSADEPPQFEPVQVAGLKDLKNLGNIFKPSKKSERPLIKPGKEQETVGPYQVMPEATPEKVEKILEEAPSMPVTGKPSPTSAEVAAGVPETAFNLDLIKDDDGVKQFIEATARAYGADKIEKVSYKEIATKVSAEGYDEAFLARILNPLEATKANPSDAYKMLLALTDAGKRAYDLGVKVKAAAGNGTLNADLASEFQQAVALEGSLLKAARGRQADIARTLGIFSEARQSTAERGSALNAIMNETGGIKSVHDFATKYIALDSRSSRAEMSASGYASDWKGMLGRVTDIVMTTWINGILSSPITHAKNIAGNTFFGAYQIPERLVASGIGKVRNLLFPGGETGIQLNEIQAHAISFVTSPREAFEIGYRAFVNNTPTDPFTKIESARYNRDPFAISAETEFGKTMEKALQIYGSFVTIPGRALMAEDEVFKAFGFRNHINILSTREGNKLFEQLIKKGVDPDTAAKQAESLTMSLQANPTDELMQAATAESRVLTFTKELEGFLGDTARLTQSPLIKIFVPFIRTPTNIMLETLSRTPAGVLSPKFISDIKAGGIQSDTAMAKVGLGSLVMYSVAAGPLEGKLTGYGPMRTGDKQVLEGNGWQQFSYVLRRDQVSDERIKEYEKLTKVSVSKDKVYISYAGLEPLASMIAIAASIGEYSMQNPSEDDMVKIFTGGTMGLYNYMSEQPMLKGISEFMKMMKSSAQEEEKALFNIISNMSRQATSVLIGGSPFGIHSSFVANVERFINPEKSLVMVPSSPLEENPFNGIKKGALLALGDAMARNPLTSDLLPPQIDSLTGITKKTGEGNWNETFNPFKTSEGKDSPAHMIYAQFRLPMYIPAKQINGVPLNDEQYTRLIELATKGNKIEKGLVMLANDPNFIAYARETNNPNAGFAKAQGIVQRVAESAYAEARKILIMEDSSLRMDIGDVKKLEQSEGKFR